MATMVADTVLAEGLQTIIAFIKNRSATVESIAVADSSIKAHPEVPSLSNCDLTSI